LVRKRSPLMRARVPPHLRVWGPFKKRERRKTRQRKENCNKRFISYEEPLARGGVTIIQWLGKKV